MLLVEDDRALAELLIWHFEREDFEVQRTGDGEEALLMAQESPPDLVVLDWMIEGISGIEVCRRLRRRPETANVPIIMLTARGEEQAALAHGVAAAGSWPRCRSAIRSPVAAK